MKIIPLSEGSFTIDSTKQFLPFEPANDLLLERPKGSLLVEIQPFAIITSKDILVIDTGLGFSNPDGLLQIHQNLRNKGINPMEVTKVLLSHLHKDHAGGININDSILQQQYLSFPNAVYYVNKEEYEYAMLKSAPSYSIEDFKILNETNKVVFTKGNGLIDNYIRYEITGAHCPFHQVYWIEEEGEKLFYGGDVAPQLQQMKNRFIAKYDFDGKKCMQLRQLWWQQGRHENWTFLFYHDIKTPVFKNS